MKKLILIITLICTNVAFAGDNRTRDILVGTAGGVLLAQAASSMYQSMNQPSYRYQQPQPAYYNGGAFQSNGYGYDRGYQPQPMYAPPVRYQQPHVVYEESPQVVRVVERIVVDERPRDQASWYYCRASNMYYPYVKTCKQGWERVPATPER